MSEESNIPAQPVEQPSNTPVPAVEETSQAKVDVSNDIDGYAPAEEAPVGQFDNLGHIDVTAENAKSPASTTRLKLTPEQRELLKTRSPAVYKSLVEQEKETTSPFGYARYSKNPLKLRTELFGDESISAQYTNFSQARLRHVAEKLLTIDMTDERSLRWLDEVNTAISQNPPEDFGLEALTREDSKWMQVLEGPTGKNIFGRVFDYPKSTASKLTGAQSITYAAAVSGAGRPSSFPLMSSGWNAFFRPATNSEWVQYYEQVMESRTELGRSTTGVGFSVSRAMYIEQALTFALEHLTGTSFRIGADLADRSQILRYLLVTDIDVFLTGFLVACHPDGYPIRMPCPAAGDCSHVMELEANLRTMIVHDRNVFTERELYHILRDGTGEMEFESVLSYQAGLRTNQSRIISIKNSHLTGDEIKIEFHVPSAWDYIQSAKRWIERVKVMMNAMVSDKTSASKRAQLQNTFFWTAPMREYGHLVKRIYIGESVIEENPDNKDNPRLDIEDYLTRASEDGVMRANFRKAAIKFMNNSVTSVVAIPSHTCPECDKGAEEIEEEGTGDRFSDCVPVDVPTVFFNLALRRLLELS